MSSQIRTRQIADGAITKEKIPAGAAIESSKLQDGNNFLKRAAPGTPHDALNERIQNLAAAINANDAPNLSQVQQLIANLAQVFKYKSVKASAIGNVNVANPGTATFDTVVLVVGDRLLLPFQSDQTQNGIYIFNGSTVALTRADDANAWEEFPGALVSVSNGAVYNNARFFCQSDSGGTLGSTAIVFQQDTSTGLSNTNFIDKETPSGAVNGVNTLFTLANTPVLGSEHVYLNGLLLDAGDDYTISGTVITLTPAPLTGEKIRVSYRR